MATISVNIPDAVLPRVVDAFATAYNWKPGGPTKAQFAKQQVIEFIRATVRNVETDAARVEPPVVPPLDTLS